MTDDYTLCIEGLAEADWLLESVDPVDPDIEEVIAEARAKIAAARKLAQERAES